MIKFTIPHRLPGLNEYTAANRGNKYAGASLKSSAEALILHSIRQCVVRETKPLQPPVIVKFTWYEKTKRRDKDNVAFAKKFILDAMQKAGILANDNNAYVAGFADSFVYGDGEGVVVEVIECEKGGG